MACFRAICQGTMGSLPSRRRSLHVPGSLPVTGELGFYRKHQILNTTTSILASRGWATTQAQDHYPSHKISEFERTSLVNLTSSIKGSSLLGGSSAKQKSSYTEYTSLSDCSNGEWWRVMSEVTNKEYSIPSSHVAKISQGWLYEGLNREKAEDLLLLPSNHGGSFLIRESQTRRGAYSLSVRLSRPTSRDVVRHYRIHRLENGWFYISPRLTFPTLQALVDHYTEMADDLCSLLKEPCAFQRVSPLLTKNIPPPVTVQRPPLNWKEVDSSLLFSEVSSSGDTCPISVGLREAIGTYISMTEDPSLDISGQGRLKKGN